MPPTERRYVPEDPHKQIDLVFTMLRAQLLRRLEDKGPGIFVSSHEILGIIEEERQELIDAVRENDIDGVPRELIDIAVASVWGIVSATTGRMDWL